MIVYFRGGSGDRWILGIYWLFNVVKMWGFGLVKEICYKREGVNMRLFVYIYIFVKDYCDNYWIEVILSLV